jgi:transcriptional regulator with XRE-family HTH domain
MATHTRPSRHVELKPGALRRAREHAGMTISGLARLAGLSYAHLAAVERGNDGISPPALARVATALEVTIAELRYDDGATPIR